MTDGGAFKEGGENEGSGGRGCMQREELLFDAIWQVCVFGGHGWVPAPFLWEKKPCVLELYFCLELS